MIRIRLTVYCQLQFQRHNAHVSIACSLTNLQRWSLHLPCRKRVPTLQCVCFSGPIHGKLITVKSPNALPNTCFNAIIRMFQAFNGKRAVNRQPGFRPRGLVEQDVNTFVLWQHGMSSTQLTIILAVYKIQNLVSFWPVWFGPDFIEPVRTRILP